MNTIGAYEAKTHLGELLDRVSRGERFTITRHGVPVAVLQPADTAPPMDPRKLCEEMRAFRDAHPLGGLSIRELIEDGRRY